MFAPALNTPFIALPRSMTSEAVEARGMSSHQDIVETASPVIDMYVSEYTKNIVKAHAEVMTRNEEEASVADIDKELSRVDAQISRTRNGMFAFYCLIVLIGLILLISSDKIPKTVSGIVAAIGALGFIGTLNEKRNDARE